MQLLPGQRFEFKTNLSVDQVRTAARAGMDRFPEKINDVWGFAIGRTIFMQAGLGSSAPGLVARVRQSLSGSTVSGVASLSLGSILVLLLIASGMALAVIVMTVGDGFWPRLIWAVPFVAFMALAAWSNHFFRRDTAPLIHHLKRTLGESGPTSKETQIDRGTVPGAELAIDGERTQGGVSPFALREALLGLYPHHFLILSFGEQMYMQALNEGGYFRLEYRAGDAARHYYAPGEPDTESVTKALLHYLEHREPIADIEWQPMIA